MTRPSRLRGILGLSGSLLLVVPALSAPASAPPAPATASAESERLHRLLDLAWEDKLRQNPEFATYIGFPGENDRWPDRSAAGLEAKRARTRAQLKELLALDPGRLPAAEQVDFELYRRRLAGQIEGFGFPDDLLVISQYGGIQQDIPQALAIAPARSTRDHEDLLARLRAVPALVDQTLALMAKGLAAGVTPPRSTMAGAPVQVQALLTDAPWRSPLLARFRQISDDVPEDDRARLRAAALEAYQKKAAPAFGKLLRYLNETYIPHCRESIGTADLPNGAAWYALAVRQVTTTTLTPAEVHAIGLAEVKRLRGEIDRVIAGIAGGAGSGFKGSFADFVRFLHTDPRFFYTNEDDLVAGYAAIVQRIDGRLASLFATLPHLPYRVLPVPARLARAKATAYYEPGSASQGRPGSCFVNTFDLKARAKWELEALALHECIPGHHIQVTLAQEGRRAPRVLNYHDYTPFVEGWAAYAETLGDATGLYRDPYARFGQLDVDLWRSLRLVVDTGIHAQGWTRQQAIEYLRDNTAQDERLIAAEVDHYIADPGVALAFKIGELKIRELRAAAEKELGPAFDLRAFHDEVLRHGALPLDLLERNVKAWMAEKLAEVKAGPRPKNP
jgi:uncharacterized protein (DUF885 family)